MTADIYRTPGPDVRPCMIVAYADSAFAARWGRFFRRQGWAVHLTPSPAEVDRLMSRVVPTAIVVDRAMGGESARRLADRLTHAQADLKVVLVDSRAIPAGQEAGYLAEPEHVLEQIHTQPAGLMTA